MGVKVREKIKGSGEWYIFINHKGNRKSKKVGKNKDMAEAVASKVQAKLTLEEFDIGVEKEPVPTFKNLSEEWLELHVKPTKRATTYIRYSSLLKIYINKHLGLLPLDQMRRADVINTLRKIQRKGASRSALELCRNVISGVSEFAIDAEFIQSNPCVGVMKRLGLPRRKDRESVEIFTKEEVSFLLQKCKETRVDYSPFFLVAFRTGMRLGEILGLEWGDINWKDRYILVQRSFRNGRITSTKNSKSRRVDMSDQLYFVLKRLYSQRKEEALKDGKNEPVSIVFHTKGQYTSQNTVRNIWKRLLVKCELNYRKFHSTRHTFASLLINNNESLAYIKELMGHHSIQMTVDVYGHLLPSENRDAVNFLDDAPICNLSATTENKKAATL
jgi:integrase